MNEVIDRIGTLGVESTGTAIDNAHLAQRQGTELIQSWLEVIDANREARREIAAALIGQTQEALAAWQRFVLESAQAINPLVVASRLQQLEEATEALNAINEQVTANTRRAEAAARKAQTALENLQSVSEQVSAGAKQAESAARRAQRVSESVEAVNEQIGAGAKRAENAAQRAQRASHAVEAVNEQVTAVVQRAEAAAERAQQAAGAEAGNEAPTRRTRAASRGETPAANSAEGGAGADATPREGQTS